MNTQASSQTQMQPRGLSPTIWLFPIISLFLLIWLFALYNSPSILANYGGGMDLDAWFNIGLIVGILLFAMLAMVASKGSKNVPMTVMTQESSGPADVVEPIYEDAEVVEPVASDDGATHLAKYSSRDSAADEDGESVAKPSVGERSGPRVIEYPPKKSGMVYGDTMIPVGKYMKLKIRTSLVMSCLLCDTQEFCFDEASEAGMSREEFLANVDCREGLPKKKD